MLTEKLSENGNFTGDSQRQFLSFYFVEMRNRYSNRRSPEREWIEVSWRVIFH